jgi:hypothetical protein
METPDLYRENLLKLVKDRDFTKRQRILSHNNSDKLAVIIDPRFDDIMEAVIRNFMHFMNPRGWNLLIVSHSKYENIIRDTFPTATLNLLDENMIYYNDDQIPNITIETYNRILLDKNFWKSLPAKAEHICIFQKDCIMFKMFQDYFILNYEFSGANYYNTKHIGFYYGGINGGFSLRRKSAMLECLEIDLSDINAYRLEQYKNYLKRTNFSETFTPLNIINRTPEGRLGQCSRATLPINQLNQKGIFDARPDSNVHRCKQENILAYEKILKEPIHEDVIYTIACEMLYKMVPDKAHRTFLSIESDVNLQTCVFHGWQYNYHSLDVATQLLQSSDLFGKYINNIAD